MNRHHTLVLAAAVTAVLLVLGSGACSAGNDDGNSDDSGSTTDSSTSSGGDGGAGGQGGSTPSACDIDCEALETEPCQQAVCDESLGKCVVVAKPAGTVCDDGLFCTLSDACDAGVCIGTASNDCGLPATPCQTVACDEASRSCSQQAIENGTSCTPDDKCQLGASCTTGLCVGTPNDCFFTPVPNDCHVGTCNPTTGICEPSPGNEGNACVDTNDLCTANKTCAAGDCVGGAAKNCSALTQGCQLGVCDVTTGQCQPQMLNNGDPCDDLDPCTTGELCNAGGCNGGAQTLACVANDNCCPAGCSDANDQDCALDILLMGDNVTNTHWDTYRTALTAAGVSWTERNLDTSTFPTQAELLNYNTLIWFEETTVTSDNPQCQLVRDWLAQGNRRLFATGIYMLWDFENAADGTGEDNLYQSWGMSFMAHGAGLAIGTLDGVVGDPIGGSFAAPNGLVLAANSDSSGDYVNELVGPAIHGARYATGGIGSLRSGLSHYNAGGYRVVWLGLNFHNGLTNATQRNALMQNVLTYFQ